MTKSKKKIHKHKYQFAEPCWGDDWWGSKHFGQIMFVCECGKAKYVNLKE